MHLGNNKTTENRRTANSKPTSTGTSSNTRFSTKRPPLHHSLLKGPYYPLVNIPAMPKT